jgi:hypothetical protein
MFFPILWEAAGKVINVEDWESAKARGEGIVPVVIRDSQCPLEVDAASSRRMHLGELESQSVSV